MPISIGSRIKNAWNAFRNKNETINYRARTDNGYYTRPDRVRLTGGRERSILTAVLNRIAMDVAAIDVVHCKIDENGRFVNKVDSHLNDCLSTESNLDQTPRAFMQDAVMSMFDEGSVALVPVDTTVNPDNSGSFDVLTMRTGKVIEWYPNDVKVRVYNENRGRREDILINKHNVCLIENPLYAVMNEPNSTLQRLIRKLTLLDAVDEITSSGKLDLIIQLPYVIKSEARRKQADERMAEIERQLNGTKYGIAYADGTEKIIQLNRPVENQLMKQVEYLTSMLYSQLGITQAIMDGTADEKAMLNYYNRTIEPILSAITDEMKRKFLTKTARTQGQSIEYFRDPFKLVPVEQIAEIADKFTRNEIMTANEIRSIVGYKPSNDPKADQLVNSNIRQPGENQNTQNADNNFDVPPEENSDVTDELSLEDYKELGKEVLSGMTNE
jgi:hypothetical protein